MADVITSFERYELKYLLEPEQYSSLMPILAERLETDEYGKHTISNIFFDTDNFEVIRASIEQPIYKEKLRMRIDELLDGAAAIPEDRLAQEVAIFADHADITEEITRLRSHMDQMKSIINESRGADGKKLDFLVQEMNREANTIGSKANDLGITQTMLQIKSEVEKIREQVQNIE